MTLTISRLFCLCILLALIAALLALCPGGRSGLVAAQSSTTTPAGTTSATPAGTSTGAPGTGTVTTPVTVPTAITTLILCGPVSAFTAPSALIGGSVTISGLVLPIAVNTTVTGAASLTVAAVVCINGGVSAAGQLVSLSAAATPSTSPILSLCGVVGAYSSAVSGPGSITIAGITLVIASGTVFTGPAIVANSSPVCLTATLNASGQVIAGQTSVPTSASAYAARPSRFLATPV